MLKQSAVAFIILILVTINGSCDIASTAAGATLISSKTPDSQSTVPVELTVQWPSPAGTHPPYLIFRTDRLYTDGHLWLKQESEDIVRIGLTYYGQIGLGALEDMGMPEPGTQLIKGNSFGCFFVGDDCMIYDFPAPINGKIVEINENIVRDKSLINSSPYDDGWMVLVQMDNPSELHDLLTYDEYFQSSCPPCHCNN